MSRVGKVPVKIPAGVVVEVQNNAVTVVGAKGKMVKAFAESVIIKVIDGTVVVEPVDNDKFSRAMWGTARNIIANMIKGVSDGFVKTLEMIGVGYKAALNGSYITLSLAKSHNTIVQVPDLIKVSIPKPTLINIESFDKEKLGQFASILIKQRPPEPYKGKGIRVQGSYVQTKEGKKG